MTAQLLFLLFFSIAYCTVAASLFRAIMQKVREDSDLSEMRVMLEVDPALVVGIYAMISFFWPATLPLAIAHHLRQRARDGDARKR